MPGANSARANRRHSRYESPFWYSRPPAAGAGKDRTAVESPAVSGPDRGDLYLDVYANQSPASPAADVDRLLTAIAGFKSGQDCPALGGLSKILRNSKRPTGLNMLVSPPFITSLWLLTRMTPSSKPNSIIPGNSSGTQRGGGGRCPTAAQTLRIPVGISNRHVHLEPGRYGHSVWLWHHPHSRMKAVKQPGQYAAEETVTLRGPKGELTRVRVPLARCSATQS